MGEKLKSRSIWLTQSGRDPEFAEAAATLLRDVKGMRQVQITGPNRLLVKYNAREITLQTIEALLQEFGYKLRTSIFCRFMRAACYYIEDIECNNSRHDLADYTREAFITRYLQHKHGCRDHRPEYLRRYL